ncbi:MAG: transporter substrate-binding domain-containing protein [Hyphomicrobiaceae bacterium]
MIQTCRSVCYGVAAVIFLTVVSARPATATETLDQVRKRGQLLCGVSQGLTGFSERVLGKGWTGFDVDYCRAVAAAVFNNARKVKFIPLSPTERFAALLNGEIDVLSRNTTWTMTRDVVQDLDFVGISYFDVQGFMAAEKSGIKSARQMKDQVICALKGTTLEGNIRRFLDRGRIKANILLSNERTAVRRNYERGRCAIYASDLSALAGERTLLAEPSEHVFLPEVLSKEPLGPVVRSTDPKWRELLQWVLYLLINAEEAEWTAERAKTANAPAKIIVPQKATARLKLRVEWARAVIAAVGNYGEIFDRNLGSGSDLEMKRGLNALWVKGGLLYAPPIR